MTTASNRTSVAGRIRTLALVGMLAVGLVFPVAQAAQAQTGDGTEASTSTTRTGLSITVETIEQLTGLTAVVSTGGDNVNLREQASDESESLAKVANGAVVNLRVDMVDTVYDDDGVRWWPVNHDGMDGWISGQFLTQATTAEGDIVSPILVAFDYTEQADAHSTAKVFGNGQNVNVRAEPSTTSEIVTKAADGQIISLRIDMVDTVYDAANTRWWPVTVNGEAGWISGYHLTSSDGAPTTQPGETPAVPTTTTETSTEESTSESTATAPPATEDASGAKFSAGDFAQVFTGDGTAINVRESGSPDAPVIGGLDDGEVVEIVSGPIDSDGGTAGWYEVRNANITGFVDGDLLITSVEAAGQTPRSTEPPLSEEEEATVAATQTPESTTEPTATQEPTEEPDQEASSAQFMYPLADYRRTQGFGCSNLGFYSYNAEYGCPVHNGLDLAASSGTPILAAGSGTVVTAGWCNCGLGYYVEIDHGGGVHTLYGHMASQPYVSAGQSVSQGDVIGPVGSTGISTGPHVHFMVTVNGTARNPENYLP